MKRTNPFAIGGALVATLLLGWIIQQATGRNGSLHVQTIERFRELKQLDTQINQYVFQIRLGVLTNYDPLVQAQQKIHSLLRILKVETPQYFDSPNAPLKESFNEHLKNRQADESMLETYKSHNAVINNSLRFAPIAIHDLISQEHGITQQRTHLRQLLEEILIYDLSPNEQNKQLVLQTLSLVQAAKINDAAVQILSRHIAIILDYKQDIEKQIRQLSLSNKASSSDKLFNAYNELYISEEANANLFDKLMVLLIILLTGYVALTLRRLSKTSSELQRSLAELEFQRYAIDQHSIVSISGPDGLITYTNRKFSEISQYQREELLGQDHRLLNSGFHPHSFFKEMWQTISRGKVWHAEVCNRRKDGELYWVDSTIVPFLDENGKPLRYVSIRTDITQRKQAQAEMLHAKEAAEEANRAKSDFLANMSHEIRTPMNGIIGMTELALDTNLTVDQKEYLLLVKTSADALLAIINDILDFSKIESGKMTLEEIEFRLPDVLSQTLRSVALRAHQKKLELLLDIDPTLPEILIGDPGRMRQVIINLVGNAIKFTPQGEIVVKVTRQKSQPDPQRMALQITVRDTGIGIPKDKFDAIFQSFSQVDTTITRHYGGTGLGLTISNRFVELMNGRIWVESELNQGSTFFIELSLGLAEGNHQARYETDELKQRVLVVDNNATLCALVEDLLHHWGIRCHTLTSGAEALEALQGAAQAGDPFQLLLLDVNMPLMNGFEVLTQVLSVPELTTTIIMMLTSESQGEDTARCRTMNIASSILKPFSQSDLYDTLMNALGLQGALTVANQPRNLLKVNQRRLHILVAEDNNVNQTLASRLLEKFGHAVEIAENGLIAIEKWQATPFDLILMDVDMPQLNGYAATAKIRELEQQCNTRIPIIGLTANIMQGSREKCLAAGMDGYLSKPIDTQALWAELEALNGSLSAISSASEASTGTPARYHFDLNKALLLMANDMGLYSEMTQIYLSDYPKYLAQLQVAINQNNDELTRHNAHTVKGMLSVFCVPAIAEIARSIEMAEVANPQSAFNELRQAMDWLSVEIQKYLLQGTDLSNP
jgi:PAS domain S-box-containing protein